MMNSLRQNVALRAFVLYFAVATAVVGSQVLVAWLGTGNFGFPLDDAWIHQVYARNLGTRFEFSFFPGQASAGSTSPLWALLLSIGYSLRLDFRVWALLWGVICLACSGWMAQQVTSQLIENAPRVGWLAALAVLGEWHMVWAAASGMEILLFVLLTLTLVHLYLDMAETEKPRRRSLDFLWFGITAGLLVLTRPEGVILVGLLGLGLIYSLRSTLSTGSVLFSLVSGSLAFLLLLAPYFYFNWQASGTLLPNTFYAKGAEYAELTNGTNFLMRWLALYRQPLMGAQLLLVPGLFYGVYLFWRAKDWVRLAPALWILLLPALYAWRLPVEYQFGRYMMPIIPFLVIYGMVGTARLFLKIHMRLVRRVWATTIAVLVPGFLVLGAASYARSVDIVNCEMVAVARWTRENVPPGALIAVHDIGAQGYFDSHPMLDLAGLVSPEVIPFIRDEPKLKAWMLARGAQYAIFFPSWYPNLASDNTFRAIYSTGCATTRELGEQNLTVYRIE